MCHVKADMFEVMWEKKNRAQILDFIGPECKEIMLSTYFLLTFEYLQRHFLVDKLDFNNTSSLSDGRKQPPHLS
jgi:hypothetical protein